MSALAAREAAAPMGEPVVDPVDGENAPSAPSAVASTRRHLRLLPAPRPGAPKGPFLVLMGALLAVGLLGLLLLNTALAQGAFVAHDLQARTAALAAQEQALLQQVAQQESPVQLERRARALGMVPGENPVFLRLEDGAVLGVPKAAKPPAKPKPKPTAPAPRATSAPAPAAAATAPSAPAAPRATAAPRVTTGAAR